MGVVSWIFLSSIKEMNSLISKRMPNIYLKVAIEKRWRTQNFDFLVLKCSSPSQFSGSSNSLNFQTSCCNLKIRGRKAKLCVAFLLFSFWKKLWWRQRVHAFGWKKKLIKLKQNREWEIPHTLLERWTLCFSSYKNPELKVKL